MKNMHDLLDEIKRHIESIKSELEEIQQPTLDVIDEYNKEDHEMDLDNEGYYVSQLENCDTAFVYINYNIKQIEELLFGKEKTSK